MKLCQLNKCHREGGNPLFFCYYINVEGYVVPMPEQPTLKGSIEIECGNPFHNDVQ